LTKLDVNNSSRKVGGQAGFSLVELMAVVGIIAILAVIVTPKLRTFIAKARQSEARALMNQMNTAVQSYYAENTRYSNDIAKIGFGSGCVDLRTDACGTGWTCRRYTCLSKHYPNISLDAPADMSSVNAWFYSEVYKGFCPGLNNDAWVISTWALGNYGNCAHRGTDLYCFTDNQSVFGNHPAGTTVSLCR